MKPDLSKVILESSCCPTNFSFKTIFKDCYSSFYAYDSGPRQEDESPVIGSSLYAQLSASMFSLNREPGHNDDTYILMD